MKKTRKILAVILSVFMVMVSCCAPISGCEVTAAESENDSLYAGDGYEVEFFITDSWSEGYNATITIKNTGEEKIENWCIGFEFHDTISNLWNAEMTKHEDNYYTFKNAGWNQDIISGQSICFGMTVTGDKKEIPQEYTLNSNKEFVEDETYKIEYNIDNDWKTGFTASVVIHNLSEEIIEDWKLEFEFQNEISNIWGGTVENKIENTYYIDNGGYNQNIGVGESVTIGFIVNNGDSALLPTEFRLNSVGNKEQNSSDGEKKNENDDKIEFDFSINYEDFDYSQEIDCYMINTELQKMEGFISPTNQISKLRYEVENSKGTTISKGNIAINENWSIEDCKLTYGSNIITIFITDVYGNVTEHQLKCYNNNAQNSSEVLENQELVNQFVAEDTDKDGLYDFLEAEVMQMNPFSKDSDGDGICDGDEDFDSDGLTNLKEIKNEIDLLKEDTDEDGLKDGEEYIELKTNPLEKDSDKDGASDSWEIDNGYDPVNKEIIFENRKVLKLEGKIEKVSVRIKSEDGLAAETLSVETAENVFLNEEVPGYLGTAVEFLSEGKFENAEVSFRLSDEIIEDGSIEPAIYYFNEEKQLLEEVEGQRIDGNIVSASLSHFSQYILLDKKQYGEVWEYQFLTGAIGGNNISDTVCVINNSASIGWYLPVVKTVINSYQINQMDEDDQMAIIPSSDDYGRDCGLENNQSVLKSCISQIGKAERVSILDAHNVSFALHTALLWLDAGLVEKCRKNSVKRIVMYTDDIDDLWDSDYMEKFIERANAQNVSIYVIDTGRGFCKEKLQQLTNATGGEYCSLMDTGAIIDLFLPSATEDDLYKDSDSDGISDYYEKEITKGNLCLGTGVGLGKLDYQNEDSDNDGLLDGEEMEISQGNDSFYIKVKSNPTKQDSDDDGLLDNAALYTGRKKIAPKDPQPLQPNGLKEVWKAQWMEELQGIPYATIDINWLGRDWFNKNTSLLQKFTAAAGNDFLTFKKDNDDMAYHSQQETWQHGWGYNDVYDMVFDIATLHNIRKNKYEFVSGEEEYVVWMWLGDYLNLGSGAEVGIYNDPICVPQTSAKHWRSIDFRLKMTLNLYNYYGPEDIENVFCWAPIEYQWWITGFNNNFMNPVAGDMISVGSIDFSGRENMFEGLKKEVERLGDDEESKFLIFDSEEPIVWFQWGDKILLEDENEK